MTARRIARALARHAAAILPAGRAEWGAAMRAEVERIGGGPAALVWALGCVQAGYRIRIAEPGRRAVGVLQWALAGLAAIYAAPRLPTAATGWTLMTAGPERSAEMLGGRTALVAVLDHIPPYFYAAGVLEYAACLAAAAALVSGWRWAWSLFLAAFCFHLAGAAMFPGPWWCGESVGVAALALACMAAIWLSRPAGGRAMA